MELTRFRIYLQQEDTGIIISKEFDYAEIFSGKARYEILELRRYYIIGKSQYTGLKDKNGKEIYENDIVKYSNDAYTIVKFEEQGFIVSTNSNMCKSSLKIFGEVNKWVVIGNIYQNTELLQAEC